MPLVISFILILLSTLVLFLAIKDLLRKYQWKQIKFKSRPCYRANMKYRIKVKY